MSNRLEYKLYYRRNLPHVQPPGATLFITTHLYGSLPYEVICQLRNEAQLQLQAIEEIAEQSEKQAQLYREEKRYFGRFDALLDGATFGPKWLGEPRIAQVVCEALHNRNGKTYNLIAFCILPNHAHIVLAPMLRDHDTYYSLSQITHVLKGYTAHEANAILGRRGTFWQAESYDHYVRDADELQRIVYYVINNPVKAGLVDDWAAWPWTFWKYAPE